MAPKISIITVALNSETYLEQTITSVINQSYKHIEYIIIDGGSHDNTLRIIKKYEARIDHWISEPDDGIADAMNKGLALASGDYILFLHSDDYLLNATVLERASAFLQRKFDLYIFSVFLKNENSKGKSRIKSLGFWTNFKMGSCHQGQLCSKKVFDELGGFNTSFKIAMDYDFILRSSRAVLQICFVDFSSRFLQLLGFSSGTDWKSLQNRFREEQCVHYNQCPNHLMRLLYIVYWTLYLPYRRCLYRIKSI